MVCKLGDTERYVKSGDTCTKCDNKSIAGLCIAVTVVGLLCLGAVLFLARKRKHRHPQRELDETEPNRYDAMAEFADRIQTKYKVTCQEV